MIQRMLLKQYDKRNGTSHSIYLSKLVDLHIRICIHYTYRRFSFSTYSMFSRNSLLRWSVVSPFPCFTFSLCPFFFDSLCCPPLWLTLSNLLLVLLYQILPQKLFLRNVSVLIHWILVIRIRDFNFIERILLVLKY